jgi:hypothetical protein
MHADGAGSKAVDHHFCLVTPQLAVQAPRFRLPRQRPGRLHAARRHRRLRGRAGHRTTPCWRPENPVTELDPVAQAIITIIWSTGFRPDRSWIDLPLFDGSGYPTHTRGVTGMPGVYVLGLPWLYTWGSGRFVGVGGDAGHLAERIVANLAAVPEMA